tara:strand:- start:1603 stop:2277 length:675 start_codon:yes stop_codon:yes gene_type:complete
MCNVVINVDTTINAPVINIEESVIDVSISSVITTNNNTIESLSTVNNSVIEVNSLDLRAITIDVERGVVPNASTTVSGKMKLYDSLGVNSDGSVNQNTINSLNNTINNSINLKVDKVDGKSLLLDTEILKLSKFSGGRTEIDFGSLPIYQKEFIITDSSVFETSNITAQIAYEAPTGKDLDEIEMDSFQIICGQSTNGTFKIIVKSVDGSYLADKFKINYSITT